jgi:hypothetical protein
MFESASNLPEPPYPLGGTTSLIFEILLAIGLERLVNNYFPSLQPYVWLVIAGGLTWKSLNTKPLRAAFVLAYSRWGGKTSVLSYLVIAVIGATVLSFYWWGISKTFVALEQRKQAEMTSTPAAHESVSTSTPNATPSLTPPPRRPASAPSAADQTNKDAKAREKQRRREQLLRDLDYRNP